MTWEDRIHDFHNLLVACVGYNYGPRPAERIAEIREARGAYGWQVIKALTIGHEDTVLDMGSGCGFIARTVAGEARHVCCADLNADFLAFCRQELKDLANVSCHAIDYLGFSKLQGLGISKVYSTAVWIHFNFYDMILNLQALHALLPAGGTIYFDFVNAAAIKTGDRRIFNEHLTRFQNNRESIAILVQYNSTEAVRAAAELTGFSCESIWQVHEECFGAVLRKF